MNKKRFFLTPIYFCFILFCKNSFAVDYQKTTIGVACFCAALASEKLSTICAKKARRQKWMNKKRYVWYESPKLYQNISNVTSYFFLPFVIMGTAFSVWGVLSNDVTKAENVNLKKEVEELKIKNEELNVMIKSKGLSFWSNLMTVLKNNRKEIISGEIVPVSYVPKFVNELSGSQNEPPK